MKIYNKKKFARGMAILIGVPTIFIYCLVTLIQFNNSQPERMEPGIVGHYEWTHKLPNGERVFKLDTPRGTEWCVGVENLQHSLDKYREDGTFGRPMSETMEEYYK